MRNGGPLSLKRGSAAAHLLALRVRASPRDIDDCVMSVVFRHVDVLATGRYHVQGSPTECGVCVCDVCVWCVCVCVWCGVCVCVCVVWCVCVWMCVCVCVCVVCGVCVCVCGCGVCVVCVFVLCV